MGVKDCINVTLKKNEVTIKIDIGAEHKNVIANLKKKLPELKKLYKEDKTPILVSGPVATIVYSSLVNISFNNVTPSCLTHFL